MIFPHAGWLRDEGVVLVGEVAKEGELWLRSRQHRVRAFKTHLTSDRFYGGNAKLADLMVHDFDPRKGICRSAAR